MPQDKEKWMELCAKAANEQDSKKLMELVKQITALLDAKHKTKEDSQRSTPERTGFDDKV